MVISQDGQITFNYKTIPSSYISSSNHTVKIGLSDAYIFYRPLTKCKSFKNHSKLKFNFFNKAKIEYTIVQYHVVNIALEHIKTGNSIILFMLPSKKKLNFLLTKLIEKILDCLQFKTCETCVNSLTNFNCIWCSELQRCSDTVDRYRQEWLEFGCPMSYEVFFYLICVKYLLILYYFSLNQIQHALIQLTSQMYQYHQNKDQKYQF